MIQPSDIRIGVLVPAGNVVHKREFDQLAPEGVTFRFESFAYPAGDALDFCGDLAEGMTEPLRDLIAWGAGLVLVGCTTASMICSGDDFRARLEAIAGVPVITAAGAAKMAAQAFGVASVAVATPYSAPNNAIVADFLERQGIRVAAIDGMGLDVSAETWVAAAPTLTPDRVYEYSREVDVADAEALYLPCTGMASLEAMDRFEKATGKPAFSSVQAGYWASLRRLGIDRRTRGMGRLLETWDF